MLQTEFGVLINAIDLNHQSSSMTEERTPEDQYEFVEEMDNVKHLKTLLDSPFNRHFEAIFQSVREIIDATNNEDTSDTGENKNNEFYCPQFVSYLSKYLLPLLPLWTGIMLDVHRSPNDNDTRQSNSN